MKIRRDALGAALLGGLIMVAGCASGTVQGQGHCGDGIVQPDLGEQCDDGNTVSGDGCSAECVLEAVGEIDCGNALDDDSDGLIDCADPDCNTRPCAPHGKVCVSFACVCPSGLAMEVSCQNGACACPGGAVEICGDNIDNNCDGQIDEGFTVTCTDPRNPAPECGSATHCMPTATQGQPGQCQAPAGSGTQYSICSSHANCAPGYVCVNVGAYNPYCLAWCTSWDQCPDPYWEDCYPVEPRQWVYNQEWGFCWDGYY